jgi:type II secretory pathway pseudopilin PulG
MAIVKRSIINHHKKTGRNRNQGFSIIESAVALTTLGIALAYSMPLFLYSKINNAKSEVRTGALMVAQRILDDTRGTSFDKIPTSGTITYVQSPSSPPAGYKAADLKVMGRNYQAKTYHCEVASECTDNYKTLRVEVKQNDATIYEMSAGFTNFK